MSSQIVIADGRRLSREALARLKTEKGVELGEYAGNRYDLYTIGGRYHARRISPSILNLMLPQARKSITPRFTIDISRSLLDSLDSDLPVYTTGSPLDIQTVGDLRTQMAEPGYTTLHLEDIDRDQMIREAAENARTYKKGQLTLAKRTIRQNLGVKEFRRIFAEDYWNKSITHTPFAFT